MIKILPLHLNIKKYFSLNKYWFFLPVFFFLTILSQGQTIKNKDSIDAVFSRANRQSFNPVTLMIKPSNFKARVFVSNKKLENRRTSTTQEICKDTSQRKNYFEDSLHIQCTSTTATADGNILICGWRLISYTPYRQIGYLIKCTPYGDTLWEKNIEGSQSNVMYYSSVYELSDRSILLIGKINVPVAVNSRYDLLLTKLSSTGNFMWQKTFVASFDFPGIVVPQLDIYDLKSTPSGDIFICGGLISGGFSRAGLAARLTSAGNVVWSKGMGWTDLAEFVGINLVNNEMQTYGKMNGVAMAMTSFDIITGATVTTKQWMIPAGPDAYWQTFRPFGITKLDNGNTILFGRCVTDVFSPDPNSIAHVGTLEISPSFNFVDAYRIINNRQGTYDYTKIKVYPNGDAAMATVYGNSVNEYLNVSKLINGTIVKDRAFEYDYGGFGETTNFLPLAEDGDFLVANIAKNNRTLGGMETFTLKNWDTSGGCMGNDVPMSIVEHQTYVPMPNLGDDSIQINVMQEVFIHNNYLPFNDDFQITNLCQQISFCDSLKLTPSDTSICLPALLNVKIYKNKECMNSLEWIYNSPNIKQPSYVNDSTVQINFSGNFSGYIKARINACKILEDSFFIIATTTSQQLNLGPDKTLCVGNKISLNAGTGYVSYQWQDGSTDSTLTVTQPGLYYVAVTDACANKLRDSIFITAAPAIPLYTGPDRIKCNNDTIHITAPAGFLNYSWSNNYYLNTTFGQSVVVTPLIDTVYYVKAEKSPGCFSYDTVRISVKKSPLILLGQDKSFCNGDSAVLNAGTGFARYQWSNGSISQKVTLYTKGQYFVIGTTLDGCKSYDTLSIIDVWRNPTVNLDHNPDLCKGSSRILHAGSYSSYLWQDGSTLPSFAINGIGTYYVSVTDIHQCNGSDTIHVVRLLPIPANFLQGDTAICKYSDMVLFSNNTYTSYLWNNGETGTSIKINQPGLYWMQAIDQYNCKGVDSVTVFTKDCMEGIYVPTAFTPNNDGKNDIFKPFIFGNIVHYEFTIYNRFGQIVFTTTNPFNGWDGNLKGIQQNAGGFTWICRYLLLGKTDQVKSGSVVLIR